MGINVPVYLEYLLREVKKHGVTLKRGFVGHITEATEFHTSGDKADLVVNCTGIEASKLGGVADANVYPARGQICLVKNPCHIVATTSGTDDGASDVFYVQGRRDGKGRINTFYRTES